MRGQIEASHSFVQPSISSKWSDSHGTGHWCIDAWNLWGFTLLLSWLADLNAIEPVTRVSHAYAQKIQGRLYWNIKNIMFILALTRFSMVFWMSYNCCGFSYNMQQFEIQNLLTHWRWRNTVVTWDLGLQPCFQKEQNTELRVKDQMRSSEMQE